nr:outer membrane beta-barrel protein [Bacteriovorax sp. HI3]
MGICKNVKKLALVLGVVFLSAQTASASLLIEPHIGYNLSGSGDAGGVEYDYNGPQLGARIGWQNLGLMLGLDYTRSSYEQEAKSSTGTVKTDMKRNEFGVFAGYNFPILVRAWGAYYFSNTTKADNSINTEYKGNTKELGVGFTGLPFLSINLMYRMVNFDEFESSAGNGSLSPERDFKEIVLGVSLPLTL